jgi:hypothetical protein
MLHQATGDGGAEFTAQMVELNTISVSFSSLTHLVGDMHKYYLCLTQYHVVMN